MEAATIKIPVGKIVFSTDRKYGGEGNLETLAQSIDQHGLINPIAVKEINEKKGYYRIIAGRRRYAAVKLLGRKNIDATVYEDKADEAAIALAENVNRDDMHPLDEAETFKRQLDEGKSVEEISKYYARPVSAIHHRIRLTNLIDGIKMMFRDGKINISGAALIASLPQGDQEKFLKKYENKLVSQYDISGFIHSVQKHPLEHIVDKKCEKCKSRTHNTLPGLFEGFDSLQDVCFDSECYAKKWLNFIGGCIAKQGIETENNIILDRGVPDFVPNKSKTVSIGDIVYDLLPPNEYRWQETKKKSSSKTAWLVSKKWIGGKYSVEVTRVAYEKSEQQTNSRTSYVEDPVKEFMVDQVPDIVEKEEQKTIAKKVKGKYKDKWRFNRAVKDIVLDTIVSKRIIEGSEENLAALYLADKFSVEDDDGKWHEIDPDYRQLITRIFGYIKSFSEIPKEPLIQKVFTLLIACGIQSHNLPDLDDDDFDEAEQSLFWKFAGMTKEEYIALYKETLKELIAELDNTPAQEDSEGEIDNLNSEGEDMSDVDTSDDDLGENDVGDPLDE
jgi:ParB/RepB/Spo0J family partition protein